MKYLDILDCDIANGEGIRVTLFVSGCSHHCKGCQNPDSWNCNNGKEFTNNTKKLLFKLLEKNHIDGLTLTGGDPLFYSNRETLTVLCKEIKEKFPNKNIWLYTGFIYSEVQSLDIMKYIDVIVDGPFIEKLKSTGCKWRGSSNQNIINLKEE